MKKLIILFIAGTFVACATPQKKAEALVKNYLKENLNDPKTYEPIAFDVIDTTYRYERTEAYEALKAEWKAVTDASIEEKGLTDRYWTLSAQSDSLYKELMALIDRGEASRPVEQDGWSITHTYRASNEFGAIVKYEKEFYIDLDFTEVVEE